MILAERDQQIVNSDPVFGRQYTPQCFFSVIGIFAGYVAKSVANPVDMGVNANPRFTETESHNEVGRFAANSFEFQKFIDAVRNRAAVLLNKPVCYPSNLLRFGMIKPGWIDQL
jgi:hypothetical protein